MSEPTIWTDASPCPWAGKFFGRKMMEIPSTFLRWVKRECPWQVEKFPGLAEYLAGRLNDDVVCVRSTTREAGPEPRGKTPKELGIKRGAGDRGQGTEDRGQRTEDRGRRTEGAGDLFDLANAMREATR